MIAKEDFYEKYPDTNNQEIATGFFKQLVITCNCEEE
jgi:hypothetical protein